jgi:RNA polymerase sigma factor (sigma-70 family)
MPNMPADLAHLSRTESRTERRTESRTQPRTERRIESRPENHLGHRRFDQRCSASCSDRCLLAGARLGDDWAFNQLFHRHRRRAARYARSFRVSAADADDAVAHAFARTFVVIKSGRGPAQELFPYLLVAVRNAVVQGQRRRKLRVSYVGDDAELDHHRMDIHDQGDNELALQARVAFDTLPPAWRRVLWATQVDGFGPQQVAEALHLTPNAAAALAMRARRGLRRAFDELETCA